MRIHNILKKIWLFLLVFSFLGLLSLIPVSKYQKSYMDYRDKYRRAPQIHVDATELYVEAVEDGEEDISKGIKGRAPKKYYLKLLGKSPAKYEKKTTIKRVRVYDKPLYVRDKNNPKKVSPYRNSKFWNVF